jgi:hypothetical protein
MKMNQVTEKDSYCEHEREPDSSEHTPDVGSPIDDVYFSEDSSLGWSTAIVYSFLKTRPKMAVHVITLHKKRIKK